MMLPALLSGFTLGAAGSLHCMGMCGPLSLALPTGHLSAAQKFISLLLYQTGRIITYSLIGLAVGLAGRRISIAGYQQWFSIGMGIVLLGFTVLYFTGKKSVRLSFFNGFYLLVQRLIIKLLKSSSGPAGFLLLGMANGLLPCGMVYIALATTLSLADVSESVGFMAMFGAGTLPAMMIVAYAGQRIRLETRRTLQKAVPFFILSVGVLLILRGLSLGIPFVSPVLPSATGEAIVCHPQ